MTRLAVDPIACTGHGVCAELLPEGVTLDEWGYPLLAGGDMPAGLLKQARRAAAACPVRALLLLDRQAAVGEPAQPTRSAATWA